MVWLLPVIAGALTCAAVNRTVKLAHRREDCWEPLCWSLTGTIATLAFIAVAWALSA